MSNPSENRAKYIIIAFIWIFIISILACGYKFIWKPKATSRLIKETASSAIYANKLKILTDSFSGYSILRSKEVENNLRAASIKLIVEDDNADCKARIKALADGTADMAVFTLDSFIKSSIEYGDWPATIFLVIDESKGADAVISKNKTIKNIEDLNNKNTKFVFSKNTPSEYLSRIVMSSFKLPDVQNDWMSPVDTVDEVYASFLKAESNDRKVYVMWEPLVSKAISKGGIAIIDSSKLRGQIIDVLVVRREFLKDNEVIVKAFTEIYLKATYKYSKNNEIDDLLQQDSKTFGSEITKEQAIAMVSGIQWKNTLENYAHFGLLPSRDSKGLPNLQDMIYNIASVLFKTGVIKENTTLGKENTLYYDGVLKEIRNSGFHPATQLVEGENVENEKVRGNNDLPSLTDEQWSSMMSVGRVQVSQISFGRGKSEVQTQGKRDIEELSKVLNNFPTYYIKVMGNARSEGDVAENEKLAQDRANSVGELLKEFGVDKKRIKIQSSLSDSGGDSQSVSFFLGQLPY